jgi:hypothetical protein
MEAVYLNPCLVGCRGPGCWRRLSGRRSWTALRELRTTISLTPPRFSRLAARERLTERDLYKRSVAQIQFLWMILKIFQDNSDHLFYRHILAGTNGGRSIHNSSNKTEAQTVPKGFCFIGFESGIGHSDAYLARTKQERSIAEVGLRVRRGCIQRQEDEPENDLQWVSFRVETKCLTFLS